MRILHVTPYAGDAWAYGGIPRVVDALVRGLARRGHYVTVCTTDAHDAASRLRPSREPATADGIEVRVFANLSNTLAYRLQLFAPRGLGPYLRRTAGAFDVAHLHAYRNAPGVLGAYYLTRSRVPYLVAPNGTAAVIGRRQMAKRVFDRVVGRRLLGGAARVLAVADRERLDLRALGVGDASLCMIPNPIDLGAFDDPPLGDAFRLRVGVAPAQPLVVYLGTLMPRKRLDIVVDGFARLPQRSARLVIAGNDMGAEAATRARVRKLELDSRVVFTGLLRGRERLEALAAADVVVYPSEHEIFGLVPVEAMLAGTPVIVADDSGCAEVVGAAGGGRTVPVGDAPALAEAIGDVLGDGPGWRAKVREAQPMIRAAYGADAVCERLERVYGAMAGSG